jgi:hypothetical protein
MLTLHHIATHYPDLAFKALVKVNKWALFFPDD